MSTLIFKNRIQAGQMLAEELAAYADRDDVIVLGLPRGGVPVAYEVAVHLHAPLDVLIVRKLGVPGAEELAMGAIASGEVLVINQEVVHAHHIPMQVIKSAAAAEAEELHRRELVYRGRTGVPQVLGKTVILVDDGIATGSTLNAGVRALWHQAPQQIIIAVPTAAPNARMNFQPMVDDFVSLTTPDNFQSVGQWYEDFTQTSDEEVTSLLAKAAARPDLGKQHLSHA
jgi:predicted phosphoribosyltransferase